MKQLSIFRPLIHLWILLQKKILETNSLIFFVKSLDFHKFQLSKKSTEYFEKILRYSEIKVIIDRINYHKKRGDLIIIASGGYNSYLEVFGSAMDISIIVSTEILFRNNICMGLINGPDCLNENKKTKLLKVINWHSIDEANSFFYSDSLSDLPMFKIVKNGFLVSFSNNEYKLIEWVYGEN